MKKSQLRQLIRESIRGLMNENHYNQQNPEPTSPVACECTHAFGHPKAKKVAWQAVSNNLGYNFPPGSTLQPYVTPWANVTVNGRTPQVGDVVILGSAKNTCNGQTIHNGPWSATNMSQIIKVTYVGGCVGEWFSIINNPDGSQSSVDGTPYDGEVFSDQLGHYAQLGDNGGAVVDYRTIPKPLPNNPLIQKEPLKNFTTNVEPQNPNNPQIDRMKNLANIKKQ